MSFRRTSWHERLLALAACGLLVAPALAGDTTFDFNLAVTGAAFFGSDSWFGASDTFLGAETDDWMELGIEPGFAFEVKAGKGRLFGELSGVYTSTADDDASGLTIGLDDKDELTTEQAHLGWRADDLFTGLEEDSFSVSVGSQDYTIGTGMLIADGSTDGAERGGWYIAQRTAFEGAVIVRLKSKTWLAEAFRLENDPRRGGTEGDAFGANFESFFGDAATLGGTYLRVDANTPDTDSVDVYDVRFDWTFWKGLAVSGEFAHETSSQIDADGYYGQLRYETQLAGSPAFSYRYAHFDGDDPATDDDELFHEIAYGATDYGSWYQGEINGNYPLANGNLNSHLVRVEAMPREGVTLNLLAYHFTLDEPASLDPAVTADDWGDEIDLAVDWEATEKIAVTGVAGMLFPGDAAEQWVGDDESWLYGMVYGSYTF